MISRVYQKRENTAYTTGVDKKKTWNNKNKTNVIPTMTKFNGKMFVRFTPS